MATFKNGAKLQKVQMAMLDQDVQDKFTGYDTSLAQKVSYATSLGFKNDGTTDNMPKLTSIQSNSKVIFPSGNYYFNNTAVQVLTLNNVELVGEPNTIFLFDSSKNFIQFLTCNKISIKNIQFKDKNYTDNVYWTNVALPALTANTNPNINVTINGMNLTITNNGGTAQGTEYSYVYTINLDSTKEYTIELADGLWSGSSAYNQIGITKYNASGSQTDYLYQQVTASGHTGQYRYQGNYIPIGTTKIDIIFYYFYAYNAVAPTINLDLTKMSLYQATKPLPDSIDAYAIQFKNTNDILIEGNTFTGIINCTIVNDTAVSNIFYNRNKFVNCFNSNVELGMCTHGQAENNIILFNTLSDTGVDVYYSKTSRRGFNINTSNDIQIRNNYIEGTYFGTEGWSVTDLLVEGNQMKNVFWAHSFNNSTGKISNEFYQMRYGWKFGIEITYTCKIDIDHISIKGKSFQGIGISYTVNNSGYIANFSDIHVDDCMMLIQYDQDGWNMQNVVVESHHGTGIMCLAGSGYDSSNAQVKLQNVMLTKATNYVTISKSYIFSHMSLTPFTGYLDKVIMRDVRFIGVPIKNSFTISANSILFDNVSVKDTPYIPTTITLNTTLTDRVSVIKNSHLNTVNISSNYASGGSIVYQNNNLQSCTIPSTAVKQNNLQGTTFGSTQSGGIPAVATGGTISTQGITSSRVAPTAAVTGVILQAGTFGGQEIIVLNLATAANSITFAASGSNVADGSSSVIAGGTAKKFVWDSGGSLWYRLQ